MDKDNVLVAVDEIHYRLCRMAKTEKNKRTRPKNKQFKNCSIFKVKNNAEQGKFKMELS